MAATTLISRELLVRTVDLAADLFLVTLGLKRRFLLRLGTFHFGICARSSAEWFKRRCNCFWGGYELPQLGRKECADADMVSLSTCNSKQ